MSDSEDQKFSIEIEQITYLCGQIRIYREILKVAREGLSLLEEDSPIAKKTLEEINKICQKTGKE